MQLCALTSERQICQMVRYFCELLKALVSLCQVNEQPSLCEPALIHCMSFFPGWGEKNFQVSVRSALSADCLCSSFHSPKQQLPALLRCLGRCMCSLTHITCFQQSQVFGKTIQVITSVAQNCASLSKRDAFVATSGLVGALCPRAFSMSH